MQITLNHPKKYTIQNWSDILNNVNSIAELDKSIKKHADLLVKIQTTLTDQEKQTLKNKFSGDVFEIFVEALLKANPYDTRLGVTYYKPIDSNKGEIDEGVDGYGIGTNLKPATVQVKWRSNTNMLLTDSNAGLKAFGFESQNQFNVDVNDTNNMLVVTNVKNIHWHTEQAGLKGKVRCIGRQHLREMVDGNLPFWEEFKRAASYIPQKSTKKTK